MQSYIPLQMRVKQRRYLLIDFLIQNGTEIFPVEVKGGEDKSAASFKSYIKNRQPRTAIRYSKRRYVTDGGIMNLPLYLAGMTKKLI